MEKKEYLFERKLRKNGGTSIAHFRKAQGYYIRITITGTILDKLGTKLDKQVAVADLVLSSFLFKLKEQLHGRYSRQICREKPYVL